MRSPLPQARTKASAYSPALLGSCASGRSLVGSSEDGPDEEDGEEEGDEEGPEAEDPGESPEDEGVLLRPLVEDGELVTVCVVGALLVELEYVTVTVSGPGLAPSSGCAEQPATTADAAATQMDPLKNLTAPSVVASRDRA